MAEFEAYPKSCPLGDSDKDELLRMEASMEGWVPVKHSHPGCMVYSRNKTESSHKPGTGGWQIFKAHIKLPKLRFFQALEYICKIEVVNRWNQAFSEQTVLEDNDDFKIIHGYLKTPAKVEMRDVIHAEVVDFFDPDSGAALIMWKSCGFKSDVPSQAKIRAQEGLSGIIVRAEDKSTRATFVLQLNLKGSMSSSEEQETIVKLMMDFERSIIEYHSSTLEELKEFYSAAQPTH